MSLLDTLFGGLFGSEEEDDQEETVVERPCSNCPGYCRIAPDACSVCQPFKEQMIDAVYWVEHEEELRSRYEVTGSAGAQTGAVTCPHCGGASEDHYVCEYCGSRLQEGDAKIRVASASEIPDPVMEAQELIFKRYDAVKGFPGADEAYGLADALSGIETEGLLSSIFSALVGAEDSNDSKTLGNKMSKSEIEEMAAFYGVSTADYLTGLDNGKYLTLSNKKAAAKAEEEYARKKQESQQGSGLSSLAGLAGLAGMAGLGNMLFGGSSYNYSAARPARPRRKVVVAQKPGSQMKPQGIAGQNVRPGAAVQQGTKPSSVRPAFPGAPVQPASKPSAVRPASPGTTIRPETKPSQVRPTFPGAPVQSASKPSPTRPASPATGNTPKQPAAQHHGSQPKQAEKLSAHISQSKNQEKVMQKAKNQRPKGSKRP